MPPRPTHWAAGSFLNSPGPDRAASTRSIALLEIIMADTTQLPIFDFMVVRPALETDAATLRRAYIRDAFLPGKGGLVDVSLQSAQSPSAIGRLVFHKVFCETPSPVERQQLDGIFAAMLSLLVPRQAQCDDAPPMATPSSTHTAPLPLDIGLLQRHAYVRVGELFYLLPDRVADSGAALARPITLLAAAFNEARSGLLSEERLIDAIRAIFDGAQPASIVFARNVYAADYAASKRSLFDALYLLYVMRRWADVNFEPLMAGLRVLHTLEAIAIDQLYAMALEGLLDADGWATLAVLADDFPALRGWSGAAALPGFPLISSAQDLALYLDARPIINPIFAQLYRFGKPFNTIKPLGVGDLKVVKQWLDGYEAGEISDIQNVMKGEVRSRVHRRLERSEESFSSTSTSQQETTRDTQSTDRFEVKREAESIVKTDLNINANVRAQYDQKPVLVSVGAGFAYSRSGSEQQKLAQNYSRELVDKAVSRVQTSTVQQRSSTRLFETEENNTHSFSNTDPASDHLSGIYQWVDKRYKAQVFNYGKRMMFEFVLPEPAAFLVDSRLHDYEATLSVPPRPVPPALVSAVVPFAPADIDLAKFNELRQQYELSAFSYPAATKTIAFVSQDEGAQGGFFSEHGIDDENLPYAKTHTCRVNAKGYLIDTLRIAGYVKFKDKYPPDTNPPNALEVNLVKLGIDGTTLWYEEHSDTINIPYGDERRMPPRDGPYLLTADEITLLLGFQDTERYDLMLGADLRLGPAALLDWQTQVWNSVAGTLRTRASATNTQLQSAYEAEMATYRNRLGELRATAIHDLIQGRSDAFNQALIEKELRRQCLAMISKEFDADPGDDLLTDWETMGQREVTVDYRHLVVDDSGDDTVVEFRSSPHPLRFPAPKLDAARDKGRFIQFLEQAFEWERLGYICYPYFWATPPKWIELMNRTDDGDPRLTAFLGAGAAKVLVAVSPSYDEAVLHFLATREPWQGGPSPVIGDPLYMPLFEELHRQQDDRLGATPEGEPWEFILPTSLVYLRGSTTALPAARTLAP
jgi:hypothetical protein